MLHVAVIVMAAAAVVSLALEFGFYVPPVPVTALVVTQIGAVAVYVLSRLHGIWVAGNRRAYLRSCWFDGLLILSAGAFLLIEIERVDRHVLRASTLYVAALQVVLLIRVAVAAARLNLSLSQSRLHPTRVLAITFVSLIVLGGLALSLPKATSVALHGAPDFSVPHHILNSLFTATSATCVTGLVVYDTGVDYTRTGQVIILLLIQAGGLGIMIFGSVFGMLAGRQLSLKQSLVLQDALSYRTLGQLRTMILFIVLFTVTAETVGALLLYPMWHELPSAGDRWFHSVFHAVSAFCNAGFALQSDSLIGYNRSWQVYGCFMPLIVLGGLGFPVLHDLWRGAVAFVRRHLAAAPGVSFEAMPMRSRFTLHTKLVLITTAVLIVVPTIMFYLFETFGTGRGTVEPETLASGTAAGRVLDALFYAVTCRTAGFNTISMTREALSPASHMLGAILMFIGGSPASTAGGVKTVALAVLLLGVWGTLRGRPSVEALGRTIPDTVVRRAAVVVTVMVGVVSIVTLLLCFTEHISLRESMFESVSACGTVGLSTGLTPELTTGGRVVIMAAMFAGRLGPLTVLIALAGQKGASRYEYPAEQVGIG